VSFRLNAADLSTTSSNMAFSMHAASPLSFRGDPAAQQQRTARRRHGCAALPKETDISTKDWRAQTMERTVRTFFDRVWTRGEVELLPELLTDDFVWKVGGTLPAAAADSSIL
jgi:hypothetical protein